jgi:hypothetical protein
LAVLIIRKRIGDVPVLSDSIIRKVYQKTGDNIRILLKTCEDLCKSSVDSGRRKVTEDFVKQYFQEKDEKKEVKEEKIEVKPKKEPIIIDKRNEKLEEKEHKEEHKEGKKEDKKKGGKVYKPEEYKGLMRNSAEELLNKSTDEIFGDEQYY